MKNIHHWTHRKIFNLITVLQLTGMVLGGMLGFAYYYFIGCTNGTCAITSNPWLSILWGVAMGYLVADLFQVKEKQSIDK